MMPKGPYRKDAGDLGPTVVHEGQRDFIGDAVAVGILLLEGTQNLDQLVGGGGHFEVQLLQPVLVDEHAGSLIYAVAGPHRPHVDLGQAVDLTIGHGHCGFHVGHGLQNGGEVGHVLQIIGDGQQRAGHTIGQHVAVVQHVGEQVGQLAGGEGGGDALRLRGGGNHGPLDVHAGLLLAGNVQGLFIGVADVHAVQHDHRVIVGGGVGQGHFGLRHDGLREGGGRHDHQNRQQQGNQFLHGDNLLG